MFRLLQTRVMDAYQPTEVKVHLSETLNDVVTIRVRFVFRVSVAVKRISVNVCRALFGKSSLNPISSKQSSNTHTDSLLLR